MKRPAVHCMLVSLWLSVLTPAQASTLDHVPSKFDLSIELGRSDQSWQRDFPIIARKLQRWLDQLEGEAGSVQSTVGNRGDIESFQKAYVDHALTKLEEKSFQSSSAQKNADISWLETRILNLRTERGAPLFRLHRLRALASFLSGRMEEATRLRRVAWDLVPPDAETPEIEESEALEALSSSESRDSFFRWWRHRKPVSGYACRIRVVVDPDQKEKSECRWNGFRVAQTDSNEFTLAHGIHELKIDKNGFEPWTAKVDCRKGGLKEIKVSLVRSPLQTKQDTTVLWVEPEKNEFKLFLHTPGVAFHEIATQAPLRVADLAYRVNAGLPVANDAFLELLSEHQMALNLAASPIPSFPTEITAVESKPQWYEDWRFWTVIGVVGAGITAGVLVSSNSKVGTNRGWVTPRRK